MGGSKPLKVYRLKSTPERTKSMQEFIEKIMTTGKYEWYKDLFIEWSSTFVVIEIYKEELIQEIKEIIVEELV